MKKFGNSKQKREERAIKRFLNSKTARWLAITSIALGVGIAIYYNSSSRQLIGVCWSRCCKIFNPKPEDNDKLKSLAEKADKSPRSVWQQLSLAGIAVIAGVVLVRLYPDVFSFEVINKSSNVEIDVPPSPSKLRQIWREWRPAAGGIISLTGVAIMPIFPITGGTMFILGREIAVHPQY